MDKNGEKILNVFGGNKFIYPAMVNWIIMQPCFTSDHL
jgi:hypothetical protein